MSTACIASLLEYEESLGAVPDCNKTQVVSMLPLDLSLAQHRTTHCPSHHSLHLSSLTAPLITHCTSHHTTESISSSSSGPAAAVVHAPWRRLYMCHQRLPSVQLSHHSSHFLLPPLLLRPRCHKRHRHARHMVALRRSSRSCQSASRCLPHHSTRFLASRSQTLRHSYCQGKWDFRRDVFWCQVHIRA